MATPERIVSGRRVEVTLKKATGPGDDTQLLLGALSPNERRLLALRLGGYSLNAAAARLGWSPRTIARRWHALRRRLARGMA